MSESTRQKTIQLITEIKALHPRLEFFADVMKGKVNLFTAIEMKESAPDYWRAQALSDALIRVRIFVENNLSHIETLGVLSLCRYTFELVVWLKHIELDRRFALVYARMLIKQQVELYDDLANHLQREVALYKSLAAEEEPAHAHVLWAAAAAKRSSNPTSRGQNILEDMRAASVQVDEKLALQFAIYSSETRHNGYGFQAHLIETQALPKALDFAAQNRDALNIFNDRWESTINQLKLKGWKWKERAGHVDMASEYDFIYSYTSRLMHATPASLTTNQKSLEDQEVFLFMRYVGMQFSWIVKHSEARLVEDALR